MLLYIFRCIELEYLLLVEYDFKNDIVNLDIKLVFLFLLEKIKIILRNYFYFWVVKMFLVRWNEDWEGLLIKVINIGFI